MSEAQSQPTNGNPKLYPFHGEAVLKDGSVLAIDFEERWADKDFLSEVERWALVPNATNEGWPVIVVDIPEDGKPIFKCRVQVRSNISNFGSVTLRAYGIGHHTNGQSNWTWVLPTGVIEVGSDPKMLDTLMDAKVEHMQKEYEEATAVSAPRLVGPTGKPIADHEKKMIVLPAK